jgi:hypothetical protein
MVPRREAVSMGTAREAVHMAASQDLVRSRRQQAVAGRRERLEPHNLAHKMRGQSRTFRRPHKRWAAIT